MAGGHLYDDGRIRCTADQIQIRGYYFPWGTKRIPYTAVRSIERFTMGRGLLNGKGRIWGSGDFKHWANLDPGRPRKSVGLFLELGKAIVPFVTPDDPTFNPRDLGRSSY